ncbi:protein KRI1 homolog [Ceratitis capitata]|uniref:Protein KRI1 homolog n=2 Tax=Ceratitis capitata TaxID=7213 RepID=A0A811UWT5_CERCA|nr:protein KRI1 homolog [Ceratitis capitata]CAD7003111.1 unnamed protein product [Ceratitis capitata]
MSKNLFDGSDESDVGDLQINTNKEYAKSYNNFRKKELLKKFKDRGYDVADSDSSSNSETSSDEDEVVDMKFDQEFLKTLASLKSKDPTIYDKNTQFFQALNDNSNESEDKTDISKNKRSKPITLKDYERQIILDKGGKFEDDSEDDVVERPASPTLIEEERRLKEEFKNVNVNGSDDDEEADTFGGIFKKRTKTKEDQDKEDADYLKWLAGKTEDIEEPIKETLKPLKNYWSSNKLSQRECFLRDFILNKGYANTKSSDIPTYDEIVGDKQPLSEDEEELEKQAEFEKKYNFRFEEPDTEFIKRYPRTIEQSVRQSDDRRKEKRQEIKERKKLEKEQKMKELELVKDMKRREIEEKIRKLKMVTGNEELGFKDEELEEDFDPAAHDQRMQEIFNDEYYQVDEGEEKPECPSDIEDLKFENWDNYDPNDGDNYDGPHCEDEDFNMDCDYDPETSKEKLQKELIENTKRRKGRKGRKNEFMELIKSKKPAFDPEDEKTYEEYIDEYYKLDCEDMIGDVPCRFKYVETTPNDFGLTIEEILLAKNKELNQWASLKKTIQIRPEHMEKKDQRLYKMKAKNEALKRKIFKSLYGEGSDDDDDDDAVVVEESKQRIENQQMQPASPSVIIENRTSGDENIGKGNKRKRQGPVADLNEETSVSVTASEHPDEANKKIKLNEDSSNMKTEPKDKKKRKKRKTKLKKGEVTSANQTITSQVDANKHQPKERNPNKTNPFKINNKASANDQSFVKKVSNIQGFKSKPNKSNPFKGKTNAAKSDKSRSNSEKNTTKNPNSSVGISDERLKAYGINPKKFHKKKKYGKQQNL